MLDKREPPLYLLLQMAMLDEYEERWQSQGQLLARGNK
jgi:hypothetical protein